MKAFTGTTPVENTQIVLYDGCGQDEMEIVYNNGVLKMNKYGMCFGPISGATNGAKVIVSTFFFLLFLLILLWLKVLKYYMFFYKQLTFRVSDIMNFMRIITLLFSSPPSIDRFEKIMYRPLEFFTKWRFPTERFKTMHVLVKWKFKPWQ